MVLVPPVLLTKHDSTGHFEPVPNRNDSDSRPQLKEKACSSGSQRLYHVPSSPSSHITVGSGPRHKSGEIKVECRDPPQRVQGALSETAA